MECPRLWRTLKIDDIAIPIWLLPFALPAPKAKHAIMRVRVLGDVHADLFHLENVLLESYFAARQTSWPPGDLSKMSW